MFWTLWLKIKIKFDEYFLRKKSGVTLQQVSNPSSWGYFWGLLFKLSVLLFFGALILFPFYYMVSASLMSYDEITDTTQAHISPAKAQWGNYKEAFTQGYASALMLSAGVVALSIVGKVIFTALMGYVFSFKKFPLKRIWWFIFLITMMLPEVALVSGQYQMVVHLDWQVGNNVILALTGPFVASVFSAYMFRNAFEMIPARTKEAALVDGTSGIKYFLKIALPMVTPTTITVAILTAFAAWNSYMWPAMLLSGEQKTISIWVFSTGKPQNVADSGRVFTNIRIAGTVLAILPMFIIYFVFRSRIMKTISRQGSAIKG